MISCVFAGSFDPITKGHESIIKKALSMYDRVFIVLGVNPNKTPLFSEDDRLKLVEETFSNFSNIFVYAYSKIDDYSAFLKENNISIYVRGIRNDEDLLYEKNQESKNSTLYPFIKTQYILADDFKFISSSLVRDGIKTNKDVLQYIPQKAQKTFSEIIKTIR